jgi:hypothetical protein
VALVLSGFVVATMWFLGAVFAALWAATLYLSAKLERLADPAVEGPR